MNYEPENYFLPPPPRPFLFIIVINFLRRRHRFGRRHRHRRYDTFHLFKQTLWPFHKMIAYNTETSIHLIFVCFYIEEY